MDPGFFEQPILNSPYEYPSRHWELDAAGQPTNRILRERRRVAFITPIPKPKKRRAGQREMVFDEAAQALGTEAQQYDLTAFIGGVRRRVDRWRELPDPASWQVTPETARLLQHWRSDRFGDIRPFFCQVEAAETAIWLTEVAPQRGREERQVLDHLDQTSREANPDLARLALKLATGAGKTTVMAMIIAWQTVNAVRRPGSRKFTRGFLVVTPGVTIRDRLRVLQPNDPDSYYASRELVPNDMRRDLERAKIVVTNYHAFLRRETLPLSKGGRALLQGPGPELRTKETEGQMLQRVMPGLMGMKRILAINDEAHHCYREKPADEGEEGPLKGDDRREAERNREAARVWISGLEAVQRKLGLQRVIDLSATPFFLRGSGYAEGDAVPLDGQRLLADGRHRVRHREAAARAGGRQHPRRRDAEVPQPVGAHPPEDAEAGPRQGRRPRPAQPAGRAADRARSAVRALREDLRGVEAGGHRGAALLHRRLQQHVDVEAGPRLHRRLLARERGRLHDAGERAAAAVPQLRRARQPARPPAHAAHRQRAARLRRGPRQALPRRRRRRDRALPAGDRRPHRRPAAGRAPVGPGPAPRGDEHRREAGHAGRIDPLRRLGLDAHRGLGRADRHARARRPRLRHAAPLRAGHRPRAPPPVVRRQRGRAVRRRVRRRPRHPVRLHREARARQAAEAARDRAGQGDHPGARRVRDPLPARGGLPRRAAGGAPDGRVRRRRDAGADPRSGRPVHHAQRGHHRRRRRPEPDPHPRPAQVDPALPPDEAPAGDQVARSRRGAEAVPVRPAQAHHPAVATGTSCARAARIRRSSCTRSWRTWPASGSRRGSSRR